VNQSLYGLQLLETISLCWPRLTVNRGAASATYNQHALHLPPRITRLTIDIQHNKGLIPQLVGISHITSLCVCTSAFCKELGQLLLAFSALRVLSLRLMRGPNQQHSHDSLFRGLQPVFAGLRELHIHMTLTDIVALRHLIKIVPLPNVKILHIEGRSLSNDFSRLQDALFEPPSDWSSLECFIYSGEQPTTLLYLAANLLDEGKLPKLRSLSLRNERTSSIGAPHKEIQEKLAICQHYGVSVDYSD
jgi:hypothetical protein